MIKRVRVNGREYTLDFSQFTMADYHKLVGLRLKEDVFEFVNIYGSINERIIGVDKLPYVPVADIAQLNNFIQKQLAQIVNLLSVISCSGSTDDVEVIEESEENEIENFLRKLD